MRSPSPPASRLVENDFSHFFAVVLTDETRDPLVPTLAAAGAPIVDVSVRGLDHTCLLDDGDPNALANTIFAAGIRDDLLSREAGERINASGPRE